MMDNNKYYTPDISDLFVGYECEFLTDPLHEDSWKPLIIGSGWDNNPIICFNKDLVTTSVRTPYLTKEQIEAEGWGRTQILIGQGDRDIFIEGFEKYHRQSTDQFPKWYTLQFSDFDDAPVIDIYFKYYTNQVSQTWEHLYKGHCPSINEFRKITKWLGI